MAFAATTIALASLAVAAVGAGVGAYASIQQGAAAEEAAKAEAAQREYNAQTANDQAQVEAEQIRRRNRILRGRQAAAAAKAGVDISGGSFQDIVYDSSIQGELDAMAAEYTGQIASSEQAYGAKIARMGGRTRRQASYFGAASTILTGAGQGLKEYGNYQRQSQNLYPTIA